MASIGLGFTLSANAQQMASGINAGVVELQKLGYAAKRTAADVSTLKSIELSRLFISAVQGAASGFTSFVAGAASAVASVDDLAKRTGVSAQTLQAYQFAAEQSGVGIETFGKSIQRLLINLGEAQTGNVSAVKSFAALGISVQELVGLTPEQTFERVAAAIGQLPTPAQQAAAAVGLFGKSGAELVPVFQEGAGFLAEMRAEAERLGVVLNRDQVRGLATLDDTIAKVAASFKGLQARVVAELAPSLIRAGESALQFIASIDVREVAAQARQAIADLADAFQVLSPVVEYVAQNPLKTIVGYITFIKSADAAAAIYDLALAFKAAAFSADGFAKASTFAVAAMAALKGALRGLLLVTIQGAIAVAFSVAAEAALKWAAGSTDATAEVTQAANESGAAIKRLGAGVENARKRVQEFAVEAKAAFKISSEVTEQTIIQGVIDEATSGFKRIAQEAGSIAAVPKELQDAFAVLQTRVASLTDEFKNAAFSEEQIAVAARNVVAGVQAITQQREAEKKATEAVAEANRKASEEAAKRVQGLAESGVSDADRSRLQYTQDLLAIQQTIADAERALADARKTNDLRAISDAEKRLRITQQTAGAAAAAAREQKRQRDLSALGLDESLLRPVRTVTDEFKNFRAAFDRGLIGGGEFRTALQNLAAEGIEIRKEIAAELARPSQNALTVSDVRTQQGASEFLRLATGRADPAIEQRAQQLAKLEEIRRGLVAIGANPVEILGA